MPKGKKITNNIKDKSLVSNPISHFQQNILFDLSSFKFCSIKVDNFTNFLKDEKHFSKEIDFLFHKAIPKISNCTFNEIFKNTNQYNYHQIKENNLNLTEKILKQYNITNYTRDSLVQFSCGIKGLRFIGEQAGDNFKLYFIDFHHLIYPDVKHNNKDYRNYEFCILNLRQKA